MPAKKTNKCPKCGHLKMLHKRTTWIRKTYYCTAKDCECCMYGKDRF